MFLDKMRREYTKLDESYKNVTGFSQKMPAMFHAIELQLVDILFKYASKTSTAKQAKDQMKKLGYRPYPDFKSGWVHNILTIEDIRTGRLYDIRV